MNRKLFAVRTTGGSMRPLLAGGRYCLVCPKEDAAFRAGDPVYYAEHGKTYIHRIWLRRRQTLLIGDDGAVCSPHCITISQVMGKPVSRVNGPAGLLFGLVSHLLFLCARRMRSAATSAAWRDVQ